MWDPSSRWQCVHFGRERFGAKNDRQLQERLDQTHAGVILRSVFGIKPQSRAKGGRTGSEPAFHPHVRAVRLEVQRGRQEDLAWIAVISGKHAGLTERRYGLTGSVEEEV